MCTPAEIRHPAGRDEVAEAVSAAVAAGRRVRVVGSGHSFTDAVLTDGTLLALDRLNRVVDIAPDGTVRVEAGITLRALSEALHHYGLALPSLGDIDAQTLAGAAATATHGTGARLPNISAALVSIELVRADGEVIEVDAATDPTAWRAARVGLGALGVVTAATVQAVPAFVLQTIELREPLDAVLDELDDRAAGNDHFEFFTFPHSPLARTKRNNRIDRPARPPAAAARWFNEMLLQNHTLELACRIGRARPALIPPINRLISRAGTEHAVDRSYRAFTTRREVRFAEMEYALPREHAVAAIRAIKALAERPEFDVQLPIEMRWAAPDDALLSPAYSRQTCYVAIHTYRGMPWEPFFRAAERLFDEFDGRPHWGKRHFQTAETLADRYPRWDQFQSVRARLDPSGVFTNDYIERVLGPVAENRLTERHRIVT